jgi:hypothetical protein
VNRTCWNQEETVPGIVITCAYEVRASADSGDSGSPVFQLLGSDNVAFSGIAFYKTPAGYLYSPVSEIAKDMGTGVNYKSY